MTSSTPTLSSDLDKAQAATPSTAVATESVDGRPTSPARSPVLKVPLDRLVIDPGLQMREGLNHDVIDDYAESYRSGRSMPPLVSFQEADSSTLLVADGFHRLGGARAAGLQEIEVEIRQGTRRDALFFAASANTGHGMRRTNADKRRGVMVLLDDPEWSKMSNHLIAEHVGVSHMLVGNLRPESDSTGNGFQSPVRITSNGRKVKVPARTKHPKPLPRQASAAPSTRAAVQEAGPGGPAIVSDMGQVDPVSDHDLLLPDQDSGNAVTMPDGGQPQAGLDADEPFISVRRSTFIKMLALGNRPCGLSELLLKGKDDQTLIGLADKEFAGQAIGRQLEQHTTPVRVKQAEAPVRPAATNHKTLLAHAQALRGQLVQFVKHAPNSVWTRVSGLAEATLDQMDHKQLKQYVAEAETLLATPAKVETTTKPTDHV